MDPDLFDQLQQNAQLQQQLRSNKHLQEINQNIAAEKALPKCPHCGGGVIAGYSKCKNCASDLIWYHGYVGIPGQERELGKKVHKILAAAANAASKREESRRKYEKGLIIFAAILASLVILLYLNKYFNS